MNNILPKNSLCPRLLPKNQDSDRFSHDNKMIEPTNYEIIDPADNKIWGYVTIDNTERGPGLGGIRMAPNLHLQEVNRLARAMTLKNSAACLPHGGAKSGIVINNPSFIKIVKLKLIL